MAPYLLSSSRLARLVASAAVIVSSVLLTASPVHAQLDPTLFLKRTAPNIILAVDVANRMQRDAPQDASCLPGGTAVNCTATLASQTSNYYDPFVYSYTIGGAAWETTLGVAAVNSTYRRRYGFRADGTCGDGTTTCGLAYTNGGGDTFNTGSIVTVGNTAGSSYTNFLAPTRLAIARAALYQAVKQNQNVARFGLLKMRQNTPTVPPTACSGGCRVNATDPLQSAGAIPTETGAAAKWYITRPSVGGSNATAPTNGAIGTSNNPVLIDAESATANTDLLMLLKLAPGESSGSLKGLIPAGSDDFNTVDAPVYNMLVDATSEAGRYITDDNKNANQGGQQCRNTVVILVVGGADGAGTSMDAKAASFLTTWAGRHVPIYVVAIAPVAADRASLQNVASKSGGQYFEVTKAQIDTALASTMWSAATMNAKALNSLPEGTVEVPELVRAINVAIQAAFENAADLNTAVTSAWVPTAGVPATPGDYRPATAPLIPSSEFQVTTPIIGTVNLMGASDINGTPLAPDPALVKDRAGQVIPQRSNLLLTAAFGLPGFDGRIRAFRTYKPVVDATQPSGWKFQSDGTPLWAACAPGTTTSGPCSTAAPASMSTDARNLYTTLADGTMIAFTTANAVALMPLLNVTTVADAQNIINVVRSQSFGTILDSTPAVMNPPSLDPPPDDTYPAFAVANKDRRTIIWVGTNRGIFEGLDARTGVEVWGFIPMNLLPKLRTLWDGQAVGSTDFMMDGSPKISDIRRADGVWRTYMFLSQGAGGTFYQTFDVTMADMATNVSQTDGDVTHVLTYFSTPTVVPMKWSFPLLTDWEPNCASLGASVCSTSPNGDLKASATALEKTVGQTWSDPAIGQVQGPASPYVMLSGSGFLGYSIQQQANRGGAVAGTTFYMFNAETGEVLDSKSVGSDGQYETQDNCAGVNVAPTPSADCTKFKNALHSDPVATGPADSRFITKSYIGDLDGRLWRFDIQLDASNKPIFVPGASNPTKLYDDALKQPIFASMATVNVSGLQYIFTGTGADLLPSSNVSQQYRLLGILDNGASGTKTFEYDLVKVDNTAGDEKVTTFPAVAGDIVFFTTTTFNPATPCTLPTASLYALTFIGGAAYDTNNDGKFSNQDDVLVKSVAGTRGTAPFIVDQHLVFGTGGQVQVFGDSADYNNGIGQAGVRILSWREVR